ncbi:hypothetical protein MKX01_033927 [Papaver californicum]|nr:hypothetical protein MKX01_033927 [Papaver californicum]
MNQKTWPAPSDGPNYSALPLAKFNHNLHLHNQQHQQEFHKRRHFLINKTTKSDHGHHHQSNSSLKSKTKHKSSKPTSSISSSKPPDYSNFSLLPYDVLSRIAASFALPDLRSSSLVCKSWRDALKPLREAIVCGVRPNIQKALDSFLQGSVRGSTLAMVDAGLIYREMGKREEGIIFYRRAAELGDPVGRCNLGISYLQADPPNPKEAVKWLCKASDAGHSCAQYQLALCLNQGRGLECNIRKAISSVNFKPVGLVCNHRQAKKWMKHAADHGHSRAQFEHGLGLFSEGKMMKALTYLELAIRAGENAAAEVKNIILQELTQASRDYAMRLADNWRPLPSSH